MERGSRFGDRGGGGRTEGSLKGPREEHTHTHRETHKDIPYYQTTMGIFAPRIFTTCVPLPFAWLSSTDDDCLLYIPPQSPENLQYFHYIVIPQYKGTLFLIGRSEGTLSEPCGCPSPPPSSISPRM